MTTDDLAGILAEHDQLGMVRQDDGSFRWECICGEKLPEDPELVEDAHYAHQAAVITAAGWVKGREELEAELALYHEYVFVRGDACDPYGQAQLKERLGL